MFFGCDPLPGSFGGKCPAWYPHSIREMELSVSPARGERIAVSLKQMSAPIRILAAFRTF